MSIYKKACLFFSIIFLFSHPLISSSQIRTARDPAVREYLEEYKQKKKAEDRAERKARRQDPHREIRPYLTLEELFNEMKDTAERCPEMVSVWDYGESVEGRELKILKISTGPGHKPKILYSANIHGNEMAGNMICLELIEHFTRSYDNDRDITYLLDRADVYVIPVLNPDGMARTVRQQDTFGSVFTLTRKNAHKVDLNRNFPYPGEALDRLRDSAGSKHKWMSNYRGPRPLSEPETKALDKLFDKERFLVHCNYHTTGGLVMSPPATLPEPLPDKELFTKMRLDYQEAMFNPYDQHTELQFYPTIGSLDDYMYHRYGTLSITMEVGKEPLKRMLLGCHNWTCSPLFWVANVYKLDPEIANNLDGAVRLAWWALRIHEQSLREWKPEEEMWVGEPAR